MADQDTARLTARIDSLQNTVRIQQEEINRLFQALQGHHRIFEAIMPTAVQPDAETRKRLESCQFN